MGAACAAGMENGEEAAAKVELTKGGESSGAGAQDAATQAAARSAAGWSAPSRRAGAQEAATRSAAGSSPQSGGKEEGGMGDVPDGGGWAGQISGHCRPQSS